MKIKIALSLIGVLFASAFHFSALAGTETHGGNGVVMSSGTYVLDLVEAGVELSPYFDRSLTPDPRYLEQVAQIFPKTKTSPVEKSERDLIAIKLMELSKVSPMFVELILRGSRQFMWHFLNADLMNFHDEGDSMVDLPKLVIIQLAGRKGRDISINRDLWKTLSPEHRAALFFHEAIYVLAPLEIYWRDDNLYATHGQRSQTIRPLVGQIFTEGFDSGVALALTYSRIAMIAPESAGLEVYEDPRAPGYFFAGPAMMTIQIYLRQQGETYKPKGFSIQIQPDISQSELTERLRPFCKQMIDDWKDPSFTGAIPHIRFGISSKGDAFLLNKGADFSLTPLFDRYGEFKSKDSAEFSRLTEIDACRKLIASETAHFQLDWR